MDAVKGQQYTVDDIYALPNGQRAELIDGEIYDMAPPNTRHQRISMNLSSKIVNYINQNNGECEVFAAPFAVFLNEDDKNYFEPDISVICDKTKITDQGCSGAPDWIIEIVSPSSKSRDYNIKLFKYHNAGVREYWIVDPETRITSVYAFEQGTVEHYFFGKDVPVGIWNGFSIKVE